MIQLQLIDVAEVLNYVIFKNGLNTYFVYPVLLLFGCVLSITIPTDLFNNLKTLYLFNEHNVWNQLFANKGDILFCFLYVLMVINKLLEFTLVNKYQQVQDEMELQQEQSKISSIFKSLRGYLLRFISLQVMIFSFIAFRGYILRNTSSDEAELTGFRISGHFIFLTAVSIGTVLEFGHSLSDSLLFESLKMEPFNFKLGAIFYFYIFTMIACILSVLVWMICLLVTALFYHTLLEKIIGLCFGMISPSVTYFWLVPKFTFMA